MRFDLSAGCRGTDAQTHTHMHTHVYIFIGTLPAAHFVRGPEDVALCLVLALLFQPISEPKNLLLQCEVFRRSKNSQT